MDWHMAQSNKPPPTTSKTLYCHGGNMGGSFFEKKKIKKEGSQKGKNERQPAQQKLK
jgi:hypothetical protein